MDDRRQRVQRILDCSGALMHNLNPSREGAWLSVDLTMPQMKTLIFVTNSEGATSGQIASKLGVGLSTVTGIVDRLTEQALVTRGEDPRDRCITRVVPTAQGRTLVTELLRYRNEAITSILSRLDAEQLECVDRAFEYLMEASAELAREHEHHNREAVA